MSPTTMVKRRYYRSTIMIGEDPVEAIVETNNQFRNSLTGR